MTADTLLLAPALDGQVSGGNGQGASGNPDTPPGIGGTQFIPGSPWDMTDPRGGDYAGGLERGGIRPPGTERGGLPGLPGDKAPIGAPPLVQDTATIADQRLAGLWQRFGLSGSSEYYGVKPGQQRGSSGWDDLRNPRLPLTAQRGAGSGSWLTGPPTGILPAFPENYLPHGNPQVPNPAAGGRQGGGTTDRGGWVWRGGKWVWDEEQGEFRAAGDSLDAPGSSGGRSDPNSMQDAMDAQDWYRTPGDNIAAGINAAFDTLMSPVNDAVEAVASTPGGGYVLGKISEGVDYVKQAADQAGGGLFGEERWQNYKNWAYANGEYIDAAGNGLTMLGGGAAAIRGGKAAAKQLARRGIRTSPNAAKNVDNVAGVPKAPASISSGPGNTHVYIRYDRNGVPDYVGITNDLPRRAGEHGRRLRGVASGLTRDQARGIEQLIKEANPHFENIRNPIASSNPIYKDATDWARSWIDANGTPILY